MRLSSILLLSIFVPIGLPAQDTAIVKINWALLETAWKAYRLTPTDANAAKVCNALPGRTPEEIPTSVIGSSVTDSIYGNLDDLEAQIKLKNRSAVGLAFRLMTIADGDFGETLDQMLGRLIRVDPRLFLGELRKNRHLVVRLDALVGNLGEDFIDNEDATKHELMLRIRSLRSVKDSGLQTTRDECITELRSQAE